MKLIIESIGMRLTPALKTAVENQVAHLEKFFHNTENVELRVELGKPSAHHKKGDVFYAEVNLRMGRNLLRATKQDHDIHLAIDEVRHMLERQLRKQKEKRIASRHPQNGSK